MLSLGRRIYRKLLGKHAIHNNLSLMEEAKSFGEKNKEDKVYIVRRPVKTIGLFSYVITTLGHILKAENMGCKIVVDMKNYENMYQKRKRDNAWEYFFEQPSGISLKEAYDSKNVILSSSEIMGERPSDSMSFFENYEERKKWHNIYKKYIRPNAEVGEYIDQMRQLIFSGSKEEKILGVLCRGTDYTSLRPQAHPVQPDIQQIIEKIVDLKKTYRIDKIFLVTEDEGVLAVFQQNFQQDLKFIKTHRFRGSQNEYLSNTMKRENIDIKQQGIDYLTQITLLAECNYFIAGRTSGSVGVAVISEGFEYEYYWDLGRY